MVGWLFSRPALNAASRSTTCTRGAPASAVDASDAAPAGVGGDDTVLAGAESYHRPACALVAGQAEAVAMSRTAATEAGLTPCRVCTPDEVAA